MASIADDLPELNSPSTRICHICGGVFIPVCANQKYCGETCRIEGRRKINRDCYARNREAISEARKADRKKHPEKYTKYSVAKRRRRAENPGYRKKSDQRYTKAHPEQNRAKVAKHRARAKGAAGDHTAADIAAQRERQRNKCFYCGVKLDTGAHVDHVVPLVLGGSNGPENLVVACRTCNIHKGGKHPMDWAGILL